MDNSVRLIKAADPLPAGLDDLAIEATAAGIRNVGTLIQQWESGDNRFNREGEALIIAVASGRVQSDFASQSGVAAVGVGGLSQCPDVPGALRVRRFYVATAWRRRGIARAIALRLISTGFAHTETLTCNARASAAAPPFWEHLGFEPTDRPGITHVLHRAQASDGA